MKKKWTKQNKIQQVCTPASHILKKRWNFKVLRYARDPSDVTIQPVVEKNVLHDMKP